MSETTGPQVQLHATETSRETREFGLHWHNDYTLYHSVLDVARELLRKQPGMTDQTLGWNIKHTLAVWCLYPAQDPDYPATSPPRHINPALLVHMRECVRDFNLVSELDVAEDVRECLEIES